MSFETNGPSWNPHVQGTQFGAGYKGSNKKSIRKKVEATEQDEFTSLNEFEEELDSEINKSFLQSIKDFFASVWQWFLSLFGIKREKTKNFFNEKI